MTIFRSRFIFSALWIGCSASFYPFSSCFATTLPDDTASACKALADDLTNYPRDNMILSSDDESDLQSFLLDTYKQCEKDPFSKSKALSRHLQNLKASVPDYAGIAINRSRATQEICEHYGMFVMQYQRYKGIISTKEGQSGFIHEIKETCAHTPTHLQHSMIGEIHYKTILDSYMASDQDPIGVKLTKKAIETHQTRIARTLCTGIGSEYAKTTPLSPEKIEKICFDDAIVGIKSFAEGLQFSEWERRRRQAPHVPFLLRKPPDVP